MNWRSWVYGKLTATSAHPVIAGGALDGPLEMLPALVYRLQNTAPRIKDGDLAVATDQVLDVYVYDKAGSYDHIDTTIEILKAALVGPVAQPGAVCCTWTGDGPEFADDELKAIFRTTSFRLIGASS